MVPEGDGNNEGTYHAAIDALRNRWSPKGTETMFSFALHDHQSLRNRWSPTGTETQFL